MKRFLSIAASCALALGFTATANASLHTTVTNDSGHQIEVLWQAFGCAGIDPSYYDYGGGATFVCSHHRVDSGREAGYKFRWGTTARDIWVYQYIGHTLYCESWSAKHHVTVNGVLPKCLPIPGGT